MSLYNIVMGFDSLANPLLKSLELDPLKLPRFRDCYLNEDCTEIVVMTRTGGGNRDEFQDENDKITEHPLYLRDEDAVGDTTFAYFYFSLPEEVAEQREAALINGHGQKPAIQRMLETIEEVYNAES